MVYEKKLQNLPDGTQSSSNRHSKRSSFNGRGGARDVIDKLSDLNRSAGSVTVVSPVIYDHCSSQLTVYVTYVNGTTGTAGIALLLCHDSRDS